ncbi:ABC-2 type transport system ATP-binding protein [Bacillus pakistanensis]|uniref:ABC-2 type transport system ATP-binding protein n=1 Tax=Rossellomorea pakistanensis TaxID=992288 RepID=A0ABS2NBE9_9BACI|nr:ABC transporter ATP-binding protein [Bacillus pakistanensis]MBM7585187.1 ABC-2 type transport system ATP-binding protein [Bacillus pakistanensis]
MNENIIQTTNLTKSFKSSKAVVGLNMQLPQGEIYGFLGPNGAGKTTTIRMLLGLMRPSHGSIRIFDQELKKNKRRILKQVGSLVESPSYYGHLTANENLEVTRKILNVPQSRINEVLEIVRLTNSANKAVKGYSLGMKQRLGIANALLGNPKLLVLDEPTNGLDPSGILEMRELIKSLPKKYGMSVLVSSHLLSEIDQMATRVGIITKGELIFQDSIDALRERAKSNIKLRVSDEESAWKYLLSQGVSVDWEQEKGLQLQENKDDRIANVVELLVKERFSIYRVEEEKMSLEDIFLDMTRGELSL